MLMTAAVSATPPPKLKNINILLDKFVVLRMDAAQAGIPMQQMLDEILALWIEVRSALGDPAISPRTIIADLAELARRREHNDAVCHSSASAY